MRLTDKQLDAPIAGLIERLRERAATRNTLTRVPDTDFATMGYYSAGSATLDREAATQLDSLLKERDALQARVKELERDLVLWSFQALKKLEREEGWMARALRAEQERDEAYERLKPFTAYTVKAITVSEEFDYCVHVCCSTDEQPQFKHFRDARDLVRRLAGPEKA